MEDSDGVIEHNVKYSPTIAKELENNIELLPSEKIELKLRTLTYGGLLSKSPGFAIVTNRRFVYLRHYNLRPDKLIYIPFNAISAIGLEEHWGARMIKISYKDASLIFSIDAMQNVTSGIPDTDETSKLYAILKAKQ